MDMIKESAEGLLVDLQIIPLLDGCACISKKSQQAVFTGNNFLLSEIQWNVLRLDLCWLATRQCNEEPAYWKIKEDQVMRDFLTKA